MPSVKLPMRRPSRVRQRRLDHLRAGIGLPAGTASWRPGMPLSRLPSGWKPPFRSMRWTTRLDAGDLAVRRVQDHRVQHLGVRLGELDMGSRSAICLRTIDVVLPEPALPVTVFHTPSPRGDLLRVLGVRGTFSPRPVASRDRARRRHRRTASAGRWGQARSRSSAARAEPTQNVNSAIGRTWRKRFIVGPHRMFSPHSGIRVIAKPNGRLWTHHSASAGSPHDARRAAAAACPRAARRRSGKTPR